MNDIVKVMAYGALGTFGLIGAVILLLVVPDVLAQRAVLKRSSLAKGKVVATGTRTVTTGSGPSRQHSVVDAATIEYTAADGRTHQFEHTYGLIEGSFQKGDEVEVAYVADAPQEALVNTFAALWSGYIAMTCAALFFIAGGVIAFKIMTAK